MLRPATPLTILLLSAFALLLISVISAPIIKAIPLATYSGVSFGVFGYCQTTGCSPIEIGYNTASLFTSDETASFDLPVGTRTTLSAILIVHPVACLFTLIMLVLAGTAHLHAPSHSPRYLLGVFILNILTFILALLSFLIDVLLFVPHMAWGSYLVLAATVLIAASGIVSCAMRRTLVSRKARQKRIAENAEMNGENFYNRQAAVPAPMDAPAPVLVNGAPGADKLPAFATFDMAKKEGDDRTSDERIPLTTRTPSNTSPEAGPDRDGRVTQQDRYGGPPQMNNGRYNGPPPRDEFGNIIPQPAYGGPGMMNSRDQSQDSQYRNPYPGPAGFRGRGGGPPGGFRGRGGPGYGGPGRGGYGPPPGRGGYGPPGRGAPMMRGGRGPPPGYNNGYGPPPGPRRAPSPGGSYGPYGRRPSDGQSSVIGYNEAHAAGFVAYGDERDSLPRAESPPPFPNERGAVGQAIEMDAATGSPQLAPTGFGNQFGGIRDSDGDVAGMVGLQQQRAGFGRHETVMSDGSRYSGDDAYVPPRQAWGENGRSSPLSKPAHPSALPAPLATSHRRQGSGDNYYEDVDPRFAEPPAAQVSDLQSIPSTSNLPSSLTPGYGANSGSLPSIGRNPDTYLHPSVSNPNIINTEIANNSYEDVQSGSRSPAESERSTFTSVSQRGINPRWNPQMGPGGPGNAMPRRPLQQPQSQRNEILLNSNPDFELPGMGGRGGGRGGRGNGVPPMPTGMVPRSAYEGGAAM